MKPQISSIAVRKILIAAVALLALAGLAGTALAAPAANQITVHNQDITSGVIMLDSVTAAQDGWVVIYKDPNFTSGEIVGYAPVKQGVNTNVKVTIDTAKVADAPTLWARLHVDNDVFGLFEWGLRNLPYNDQPVVQNGQFVVTGFGTAQDEGSAASAPATTSAPAVVPTVAATPAPTSATQPATSIGPIVVKNQDLNTGIAVLDSVKSPQDGWVVVYKNPNLTSGDIVGYAPVMKGDNSNVKVTLDAKKVGDAPTLWVVLQADNGVPGLFEWGLGNFPYNDTPIMLNGHEVVTAFGTAANQ